MFAALFAGLALASLTAAVTPGEIAPKLEKLPPKHRVLTAKWPTLAEAQKSEVGGWVALRVIADADGMLERPPCQRVMDGRRLLDTSRKILYRVNTLVAAYHLTGKAAYADRAVAEMRAAAEFTDWNPSHFLDVGEMALALAIGADALADRMTPEDRALILDALYEKAVKPGLAKKYWWKTGGNNWTQVCHAGLVAAALVTAELDRKGTAKTIADAVNAQPKVMRTSYAPNGVYPEGPGYWDYGTSFQVVLIALVEHAFGTDFGLNRQPGYDKTGDFILAARTPTGFGYNYSDCGTGVRPFFPLFYLARTFGRPDYFPPEVRAQIRAHGEWKPKNPGVHGNRMLPLALLRLPPDPVGKPAMPPLWYWSKAEAANPAAMLRTAWTPDSGYLGIKGGSPSCSHGHMDVGSFIYEANQVRWVVDPGAENYTKIEKLKLTLWNMRQESDRWKIFRIGPEAHAILRIDGAPQPVGGRGEMSVVERPSGVPEVRLDLSKVYPAAKSVLRTAQLSEAGLTIADKLTGLKPGSKVTFQFLTQTRIAVSPDAAVLSKSGKKLTVSASVPVEWQAIPAKERMQSCDTPFKIPATIVAFTLTADKDGKLEYKVTFRPQK